MCRRTILGEAQEKWLFDTLGAVTSDMDGDRPAGADLRARHGERESGRRATRSTSGTATPNRATACSPTSATRRRRTRSSCPATCTRTGAPTSRSTSPSPTSPTIGVEFTNSSVTSGGDGSDVQPTWEAMRERQPAHHLSQQQARLHRLHGDDSTMKADFRIVDRVTVPNQPARTARTMVVEAGRPGSTTS